MKATQPDLHGNNAATNRLLIVGCGYLGMAVARAFRAAGWQVVATTRSPMRAREWQAAGMGACVYDALTDDPALLPVVDVVVYCVGYDRSAGVPFERVYVDGARRTAAGMPPPRRLIYISSTGVHGDAAGAWVNELTPPQPLDASAEACLAAERALTEVAIARSFDLVILRLAGLYGPGRTLNAAQLLAGKPIEADPQAHLNLIHVDDAARVVLRAAEQAPANSLYLVSDGEPVRRREFYQAMAERLGAAPPAFDLPGAKRRRGDRRVSIDKLRRELGPWTFRSPLQLDDCEASGP